MKKYYLLIFVIFILFKTSVAQADFNTKVIYQVKVFKSGTEDEKNEILNKQLFEEIENLKFELLFQGNEVIFQEIKSLETNPRTKYFRKIARVISDLNYSYYNNLNDLYRVDIIKEFDNRTYLVTGNINEYKWIILNEEKKVLGHLCKKAITTKNYKDRNGNDVIMYVTAWFSSEMSLPPVSIKDYTGLPGLILELHEGNKPINNGYEHGRLYYATEIINHAHKKLKLNIPKDAIRVNEKEYDKIVQNSMGVFEEYLKN